MFSSSSSSSRALGFRDAEDGISWRDCFLPPCRQRFVGIFPGVGNEGFFFFPVAGKGGIGIELILPLFFAVFLLFFFLGFSQCGQSRVMRLRRAGRAGQYFFFRDT